jgi:hypothetical protein
MDEQASSKPKKASQAKPSPEKPSPEDNARAKAASANYEAEHDHPGRRSSEDRANAFNTLAWIVEGATGLAEELRHSDLGLSEEFWVHLYAARREGLLAARAAIDSLLAKTEKESQEAQAQSQRQARRGGVTID